MSHFDQIRELFLKARQLPAEQRGAFLDAACAGDPLLRKELDGLLAADAAGDDLLSATRPVPPRMPTHIGPYQVLEVLGEGGMGTVYKAQQHTPISRTVAIKVIIPGCSTRELLARFEAERRALARMSHPNIATVLDAGTTDNDLPYFAMEFVPGKPITTFADLHSLTIRQRLVLFAQVCDAIAHAHSKGIIHRDIKASNVLAYMQDGKPFAKIIDFGIAKAMEADRFTGQTLATARGRAMGTYEYMSPEQAQGAADIDTLTDVYSLGVLLYELLTGEAPFDAQTLRAAADEEIRRIIREVEPLRPSTRLSSLGQKATDVALARQVRLDALTRELRSELEWIPLMAMRKERQRRYNSPQQLAQDIANYLEGRPLIAGPESRAYKLKKFIERRKTPILAGAVAGVGLAVGAIGLSVGLRQPDGLHQAAIVRSDPAAAPPTVAIPLPVDPTPDLPDEDPPQAPGTIRISPAFQNGDMTQIQQGTNRPSGWTYDTPEAFSADTSIYHSQPASLRITNARTANGAYTSSDFVRGRPHQTYQITGWYRTEGDISADVHFLSYGTDQNKSITEQSIANLDGATEWRRFSEIAVSAPDTASLRMMFVTSGKGSLWLDDLGITPVARPALVVNGDMTLGEKLPDAWNPLPPPKPPQLCERDITVYRSAPASVRLGMKDSDAGGWLQQGLPLVPGKMYRARAYVKSTAGSRSYMWVLCYRRDGKERLETALNRVKMNSGWTLYQAEVTPPPDTILTELKLRGENGPVWFDDISVEALPAATSTRAPVIPDATPPETQPELSPVDRIAEENANLPAGLARVHLTLPNADMSIPWEGAPGVAGWGATRDTSVFRSAPASLRITNTVTEEGPGAITERVRTEPGRTYALHGWYRTQGSAVGSPAIFCLGDVRDAKTPPTWWEPAAQSMVLDDAPQWKQFHVFWQGLSDTHSVQFHLRAKGEGTLWYDDLRLEALDRKGIIYNGDMALGDDVPDGWATYSTKRSDPGYSRDTAVFRSAPASLRVSTQTGQSVLITPGRRHRLSVYIRDPGPQPAGVTVPWGEIWFICRTRAGAPIETIRPARMRTVSGWALNQVDFVPPDDTCYLELNLAARGGPVWFDDISIEAIEGPAAP